MNALFTIMKHELLLTLFLFVIFFFKLGKGMRNETMLSIVQVLLLVNFIAGFFFNTTGILFDGMYVSSDVTILEKNILNLGIYLISLVCSRWLNQSHHLPEFFVLMLAAQMGLFFMISSGNLLMFFLALELATIPVAAMANYDLEHKQSSEGAVKYILSSAFSSGILLFGISLIYGSTGTIRFELFATIGQVSTLQILAFIFLFAAFAFKLSIVPFHLWTADVYEGSPVATTSYLSIISKGATAFVFMTVLYKVFAPLMFVWNILIIILAIATMVIGNIFALRQNNIRRFLAFSSIAQVGFILVALVGANTDSVASIIYFVLVYLVSNLGAFGVASIIQSATNKDTIEDYKGMYQNNPFLSWVMALALFSLAGIPPVAGFFGKLFLIRAGASSAQYWFIIIAAINMMVALYYYLRVVRAIFMDKNSTPLQPIALTNTEKLGLIICSIGILITGLFSPIYDYIAKVVQQF